MEIDVIILENGRCKTVNPLGKEPKVKDFRSGDQFFFKHEARAFKKASEAWQLAEDARQEFEIEPLSIVIGHNGTHNEFGTVIYEVGKIYKALIVNNRAQINHNQG